MKLNRCSCGAMPQIIINRNPYKPNGCYVGKVVCNKCKAKTREYGLSSMNREFLIEKWNKGYIISIDEQKTFWEDFYGRIL